MFFGVLYGVQGHFQIELNHNWSMLKCAHSCPSPTKFYCFIYFNFLLV